MSPVDLSSYKSLFIQTAKEFLENLKKNLNLLQQNTTDKTAIYEIFRSAHTIKGQCLMMGFPKTAELCKVIEDAFHAIHDGQKIYAQDMLSSFSEAVESLNQSILSIEQNNKEADLTENSIKLQTYLKAKKFAFTLIELVVVVGIVAILLAISLIIFQSSK